MYPPPPSFTWLRDPRRAELLGHIAYEPAGGDNIRIVNGWDRANLLRLHVPQLANLPGTNRGAILFHRRAAMQFQQLVQAWEAAGLLHLVQTWDGGYVPRFIRGQRVLSNHAYGTAFDINARWNVYRGRAPQAGEPGSVAQLVPIANAFGFWWGGHWNYDGRGSCDGMHFEWAEER